MKNAISSREPKRLRLETLESRRLLAGDLDPTFHAPSESHVPVVPGIVVTESGTTDFVRDVVVQPDGKILAAGGCNVSGGTPCKLGEDFFLTRYNEDGSLDTSFGSGGKAIIDIGGSDTANAVAMVGDKIIVVGTTLLNGSTTGLDTAIVRLNSDGSADTSFGDNGIIIKAVSPINERVSGVAVLNDGTIGVSGTAADSQGGFIIRYTGNGLALGGTSFADTRLEDIVAGDGKFTAAGSYSLGNGRQATLVRIDASGVPDPTFDGDGQVVANPFTYFEALTLHAGDGIVAVGSNGQNGLIYRYEHDGTLDTSFSRVTQDSAYYWDVAMDHEKRLVVANTFDVRRHRQDGSLDPFFGTPALPEMLYQRVAVQADGKIVAGGGYFFTGQSIETHLGLARFLDEPPEFPDFNVILDGSDLIVQGGGGSQAMTITDWGDGRVTVGNLAGGMNYTYPDVEEIIVDLGREDDQVVYRTGPVEGVSYGRLANVSIDLGGGDDLAEIDASVMADPESELTPWRFSLKGGNGDDEVVSSFGYFSNGGGTHEVNLGRGNDTYHHTFAGDVAGQPMQMIVSGGRGDDTIVFEQDAGADISAPISISAHGSLGKDTLRFGTFGEPRSGDRPGQAQELTISFDGGHGPDIIDVAVNGAAVGGGSTTVDINSADGDDVISISSVVGDLLPPVDPARQTSIVFTVEGGSGDDIIDVGLDGADVANGMLDVNGSGGNDVVAIDVLEFINMDVDVDGGNGSDLLDVGVRGTSLVANLDGGSGHDIIDVGLVPSTRATVFIDGGAHADNVDLDIWPADDNGDGGFADSDSGDGDNGSISFHGQIKTRGGRDHFSFNAADVRFERFALDVDLGRGRDIGVINMRSVELLGHSMIHVDGRAGGDVIRTWLVDTVLRGHLEVNLAGQRGADVLSGIFEFVDGSEGTFAGGMHGGGGNDDLLFHLFANEDIDIFESLAIGGAGRDACDVTGNVETLGCEL